MSEFAALVESVEQIAEHHGRSGQEANAAAAVGEAFDRHPDGIPVEGRQLDTLFLRYWQHYAAGVKHPEETTDVTLRRWREESDLTRRS